MPHIGEIWPPSAQKAPMSAVTLGASPATVAIPRDGLLVVSGGSPSLVEYGRDAAFIGLGITSGPVPVRAGDSVRITYLLAPTVTIV